MLLNGKPIEAIDEQDLLSLVGTEENKTIDFKRAAYQPPPPDKSLPSDVKEKWKRDVWIDVCSFANARGGWIICGMSDKEGIADDLCGLGAINPDVEVRRLEQCITNGIEPKISGLRVQPIRLADAAKGHAIVIYVPQSFVAPHRVKESSRFHIRRSKGNDEMDLSELKTAFNLAESYVERVKSFRKQRIEALAYDEQEAVLVLLEPGIRFVLHSIPLNFLDVGVGVQLKTLTFTNNAFPDYNMQNTFTSRIRFNLDGLTMPVSYKENQTREYFHVFRNGVIEYGEVQPVGTSPSEKLVYPLHIEEKTLTCLSVALKMQKNLGVEPPLVVMLSLLGVKDCRFQFRNDFYHSTPKPIDRNMLLVPDIVLEDYEQDLKMVMQPIFDILWNCGGFTGSPSYDEKGNWIRK